MTGKRKGFSLFEMLIVVAIMGVIALAAVPVAEISYIKTQETLLENNLATIREAILLWNRDCRNVVAANGFLFKVSESQMLPPTLEAMVNPSPPYVIDDRDGNPVVSFYPRPYLNAMPADPFIGAAEWVVHYASAPKTGTEFSVGTYAAGITSSLDSTTHVGVFDVSCNPDPARRRGFVTAIDGTKYEDW
ncbi:MAG: hypothetical protein GQF41_0962 [Candidatus Rifleibacterium amylolyticum]|nr:MAG: hypothetical protein GQF41_0962 [Candidatus Rifleibacterium amylolyticum]